MNKERPIESFLSGGFSELTPNEKAALVKATLARLEVEEDKPLKEKVSKEDVRDLLSFYFVNSNDFPKLAQEMDPILSELLQLAPNDFKFQLSDNIKFSSEFIRKRIVAAWNSQEEGTEGEQQEKIDEKFNYDELIKKAGNEDVAHGISKSLLNLGKAVEELKGTISKWLDADPFIEAFSSEIALMKEEPEWADADLANETVDYEGPVDSLHNKAIAEAYKRAEEKLIECEKEQQPELFEKVDDGEEREPSPTYPVSYEGVRSVIRSQYQVNSLVQRFLVDGKNFNKGTFGLDMGRGVITKVSAEITEDKNIKGIENLTGYEWEVSNALYTLWIRGFRRFTLKNLYQVLIMDPDVLPSKEKEEELAAILFKFRNIDIKIDASDELRRITKDKKAKDIMGGKYFELRWRHETVYGQDILFFYFVGDTPPIVLDHAMATKRVIAFPQRYFQIKGKKGQLVYNTAERTALNGELLRRIRQMQDPKTKEVKKWQSDFINFENLFELLSIENKNRTQKMRNRESVFLILDHLKKEKLFKNYKTVKEGRGGAIKGVRIEF